MWIRLLQHFRFPEEGYGNRGRMFSPGHVREVSDEAGAVILQTMAGGRPVAEALRFEPITEDVVAGVLTAVELRKRTDWMDSLELELAQGERDLPWERTMLWDGRAPLRLDLIPRGFDLLEKWEMAAPIIAGTADYDARVMWIRRTETTERIMELWRKGGDLMAALDEVQPKPLLCALPAGWIVNDD